MGTAKIYFNKMKTKLYNHKMQITDYLLYKVIGF